MRARVEHIFGAQAAMRGHLVRTIGLARAKFKIGLLNLTYNLQRLVQLSALAKTMARGAADRASSPAGIRAPAVA